MPKIQKSKRNSASQGMSDAAAKTKAAHSIFKMNTDIGQHVLKNPGIAGMDQSTCHFMHLANQ
jgi:18S rRNA (adenine1779-N6/adenine1780-N6)-dimethyltransferase